MTDATPFLAAHASGGDWQEAAVRVADSLSAAGPEHRLGFLYVTDEYAAELGPISAFLKAKLGVPHWVGTVGFGVCASGREYFGEPAMTVMLAALPEEAFRVFSGISDDLECLKAELEDWHRGDVPPLIVLHADPRNRRVGPLVSEIAEATDGFLVGGLAAANQDYRTLADCVEEGCLSGVMLALDQVPVQSGLTQGCSPIGPVHEVTSAEENVLIELDGRPALDAFKEDIGEVLSRDLRRVAGYIFAALPVTGTDTGDYLVRNLLGIDPSAGAIAIGEFVSPGDQVLFCRRDRDSAVEDMQRMLDDLRRRVGNAPVRGGLYFSCCARGPNQFGSDSEELRMIEDELGSFPLVGFFANGEISNNRLYGYTGVLTLFV